MSPSLQASPSRLWRVMSSYSSLRITVPARTSGSRARKRPRARRSGGTQALVVTSPEPMSSSSARRTISFIFAQLGLVFGELGPDRIDHLGRGLRKKRLVAKLPLRVGDVLLELVDFLFDALSLGVLLAFGHLEDKVEFGVRPDGGRLGRDLALELQLDVGQTLNGGDVALDDLDGRGAAVDGPGELLFGVEL